MLLITTLKSISFVLERGHAVYLHLVLMDLLFRPSAPHQIFYLLSVTTHQLTALRLRKKNSTWMIVGIVVGGGVLFLVMLGFCSIQRRKRRNSCDYEELHGIDVARLAISYSELKTATVDFNLANKLGEGGSGPVYKAHLMMVESLP